MPNERKPRVRRKKKLSPQNSSSEVQTKKLRGENSKVVALQQTSNNKGLSLFSLFPPNCSICDDKICFGYSLIRKLPCGHGFGEICIDAWILLHKRCPSCYTKVDHFEFFGRVERNTSTEKSLYSKAIFNANIKIGITGVLAGGFVAGAEAASDVLSKAGFIVSEMITEGTSMSIRKNLTEKTFPRRPIEANEKAEIKNNVAKAKLLAGATAAVTGAVSHLVGTGIWAVGSLLAPAIASGSKKVLTSTFNMDEERASITVEGAMEITKGVLLSAGKVIRGLEHASCTIVSSAASNAARVYELNRGIESGELESDVGEIAKHVVETAWNIRALPPKSLATVSRTTQPPYEPTSTSIVRYQGNY